MDGGHDIEAAMNPSLHDEEEDENSFYIKINEKDTPVDLFKSPEVEVIHIYRVKALWEFNVFVVQVRERGHYTRYNLTLPTVCYGRL